MRGTFANVRLRNKLAPGTEGGVTRLLPEGEGMSIFDASVKYAERGTPLVILAGKEYGSGSSRDWAAKGPRLLGVRAVIAQSYERIHRSNLVGMGILPLQFESGQSAESLGLTGEEVFDLEGIRQMLEQKFAQGRTLKVKTTDAAGVQGAFQRNGAHRHAAGNSLLREWWDPAVCIAAASGKLRLVWGEVKPLIGCAPDFSGIGGVTTAMAHGRTLGLVQLRDGNPVRDGDMGSEMSPALSRMTDGSTQGSPGAHPPLVIPSAAEGPAVQRTVPSNVFDLTSPRQSHPRGRCRL